MSSNYSNRSRRSSGASRYYDQDYMYGARRSSAGRQRGYSPRAGASYNQSRMAGIPDRELEAIVEDAMMNPGTIGPWRTAVSEVTQVYGVSAAEAAHALSPVYDSMAPMSSRSRRRSSSRGSR